MADDIKLEIAYILSLALFVLVSLLTIKIFGLFEGLGIQIGALISMIIATVTEKKIFKKGVM